MWNCSNPHSRILDAECGIVPISIPEFWNGILMWISIPHSTFQCTLARWGMRHSQKEQFHIPHSKILEWNWNVGFHSTLHNADSHSTFHIPMHFSKVRNETFSKKRFHIPPSRNLEWNWNVDFHSTFHIPMHFSKLGNETFSKRQFHIPHSKIMEWDVEFSIPHSTFQCTLAGLEWDILKRTIPHSTFQNSGMGIEMWNLPFHIPHSTFQWT